MNYEELLASRNGATMIKDAMPFGLLYKKMSGNSYTNVLDLRHELTDNLRFCEALKAESEQLNTIVDRHQLHFQVTTDSSGLSRISVEHGNFSTLERLINERPSIVAENRFVEQIMTELFEYVTSLNNQGIYHLCFAPACILLRKGSNDIPLLLFHGSSYLLINDQESLYGPYAEYVAPEVLEEGAADARSDVYSLGKLLAFLYRDSSVPFEYRPVIKKATKANPEKRYKSAADMLKAMKSHHVMRSSLISGLAAAIIALICLGIYIGLTPEEENVEFVEAAPKEDFGEDIYSAPEYDPSMELKAAVPDSSVTHVDEEQMRAYEKKAEDIFRKRYSKEADRILSKIYNNEKMNTTEKKFLDDNANAMKELTQKQMEMGNEAGLSDTRSQRIATEIIERISNDKKAKMGQQQYGIQK